MDIKLFDSELKIMELLWKNGEMTAKELAAALKEEVGWSKTTTYTVIGKCVDKGAVQRSEPNFCCRALITQDEVREYRTDELIEKMYDGSADALIASLLGRKKLSADEIASLRKMVEDLK